ncbi:MAG: carboxymuconolactone decarboxylase family protein [Spirochaetales bacterium]|nr:carboxymuconolactone decarboxylase family protein [Spirochaetales bacterium]
MRLDYLKARPDLARHLYGLGRELAKSTLPEDLRELVSVRISQINKCSFCIHTHIRKALAAGVTQSKLDLLVSFRELEMFSSREKIALEMAESMTLVSETHVPDFIYDAAKAEFSEDELIDVVYQISLMNAWNRLSITFRTPLAE